MRCVLPGAFSEWNAVKIYMKIQATLCAPVTWYQMVPYISKFAKVKSNAFPIQVL